MKTFWPFWQFLWPFKTLFSQNTKKQKSSKEYTKYKTNTNKVQKKQEIASFYRNSLRNTADIKFQRINDNVASNEWLFTIRTSKAEELMSFLNKSEIMSRPFWMPMSMLPMYKDNYYFSKVDQSRAVHETCLTLPCSTGITVKELNSVVQKIKEFF